MTDNLNCLLAIAIVFLAIFQIIGGVKIVPEYQRLVVFRLGKPLNNPKGPGLVFLIPFVDKTISVDLREQKRNVLNQEAISKDYIPVTFDFCWYYKILDPIKSVMSAANSEMLMAAIIIATLRDEIQTINSTDLQSEFLRLKSDFLRNNPKLRDLSENIGIVVTHFEVLKLVIDDRRKEINDAKSSIGAIGETQTVVHGTGTVMVGEKAWDAMSALPIAPKTKVRVKRVILEVEESR